MPRYTPATIEPKWQAYWEEHQTFRTPDMPPAGAEKLYVLDMFPYPSGSGLHVGHPEGYTATDIFCRYARMNGKCVLHPMGFDAFGLPAEEHAIRTGQHPRINTEQNIATFTRQLKMLGFSYDWSRNLATTDVEYFRWTQWIFLVLFDTWYDAERQQGRPISELPIPPEVQSQGEAAVAKYRDEHRLAYQSDALVNWCPELGTVLANEEVIDGKSERGGHPVVRMPLRQWMLRITAYADRLENDLEPLDWSDGIKKLQRDWIGRSVGAEVDFYIGPGGDTPPYFEVGDSEVAGMEAHSQLAGLFVKWKETRAEIGFTSVPGSDVLRIYTTRPDTLFGATYMVLAPEHPAIERITHPDYRTGVLAYCERATAKSDRERQEQVKRKTGIPTGGHAFNPVNGHRIPIYVADYVLWGYGTGAIMAVPAHDERDFEFAGQYSLPVIAVVDPGEVLLLQSTTWDGTGEKPKTLKPHEARQEILDGKACFVGPGVSINSNVYNGLTSRDFKRRITIDLLKAGIGREAVNYKLRDWLFSRQRFWGEPFPILHELDHKGQPTGLIHAVEVKDLPVDLPHLDDYKPAGAGPDGLPAPPLARAPQEWLEPTIGGKKYRRETNTMPQWAGSCWYFLRFIDPRNDQQLVSPAKVNAWMPIDLYVGGAEHAVLHLLYSRFWHKVLFDRGHVSSTEPFQKLVNQGMILGEMEYRAVQLNGEWVSIDVVPFEIVDAIESGTLLSAQELVTATYSGRGRIVIEEPNEQWAVFWLPEKEVDKVGEHFVLRINKSIRVHARAFKMSKARGNVVNPDDVVRDYGADSLRLFEMFMGPLEAVKPWSTAGVVGVRGFLDRVWRLMVDDKAEALQLNESVQNVAPTEEQSRTLHKTIKHVTHDIQRLEFNTAIARMMEFTNFFTKESVRPREVMEKFVLILSPFAPHLSEELWQLLGHEKTLAYASWPQYDEALTRDAQIEIPVQILGKLRGKVVVPAGSDQATIMTAARSDARIAELLSGKEIVKTIVVPGKLVNFVVK